MDFILNPEKTLDQYKVHLLVFLLASLAALTLAHPAFFVNDDWIAGNQLAQMNAGHQIIINEGKYGSFENGTPLPYFSIRQNYLPYSLFLPIFSLPAEWLAIFFGDNFVFFILYFWTFLLIAIVIVLNAFFPEYTFLGKWRWTTVLLILTFAGFFLNLYWYTPFDLSAKGLGPEIMAIVFTNILLFAVLAVLIYEILRMIFQDPAFAFFGTVVCLSCSSYLFWTTTGKDHILVVFVFSAILLMLIRFLCMDNPYSLAGGFILGGLLVWARPEVGFFVYIAMCVLVVYVWWSTRKQACSISTDGFRFLLAPIWILPGLIPFFINNYLATQNIFTPAYLLQKTVSVPSANITGIAVTPSQSFLNTFNVLFSGNILPASSDLPTFPADVWGIFFAPLSGSMGVIPLIPIFLTAILILPVLILRKTFRFDQREKLIAGTFILISCAVLCAYINRAWIMNTDLGIIPDIRYLTPIYLPLTIIGLMIFRKHTRLMDDPISLLLRMLVFWLVFIPASLILILWNQSIFLPEKNLFSLLNHWTTLAIFILALLFVGVYLYSVVCQWQKCPAPLTCIFAGMCALPLVWQIDASFLSLLFLHDWGGYLFWIPVLLKIFNIFI